MCFGVVQQQQPTMLRRPNALYCETIAVSAKLVVSEFREGVGKPRVRIAMVRHSATRAKVSMTGAFSPRRGAVRRRTSAWRGARRVKSLSVWPLKILPDASDTVMLITRERARPTARKRQIRVNGGLTLRVSMAVSAGQVGSALAQARIARVGGGRVESDGARGGVDNVGGMLAALFFGPTEPAT
jgi:hypothetical protein